MKKIHILSTFFLLFIILNNCSGNNKNVENIKQDINPENLYKIAIYDFENQDYENAKLSFNKIISNFPLSNESLQSQLMIAFIEYINMNYDESVFKFNNIIKNYPSYASIDYAYYMRALCFYEQINNENLDGQTSIQALENFNQIINRFPKSKYKKDSVQKIILIKENIASKNMNIASYYSSQKNYNAAINRYKEVVEKYSETKYTPEALHRLVEIYYQLGIIKDAEKTAAVIAFNYPDSKWYEYSYNLLNKDKVSAEKKSFISKLSQLFNNDDKKK